MLRKNTPRRLQDFYYFVEKVEWCGDCAIEAGVDFLRLLKFVNWVVKNFIKFYNCGGVDGCLVSRGILISKGWKMIKIQRILINLKEKKINCDKKLKFVYIFLEILNVFFLKFEFFSH